jgi:phosphoribosylaminoimidazole-succinocarboxamide synthase
MGSVKDLTILEQPGINKTGSGIFTFSDRYSVFDWGEMPDHIYNKGKALCLIGAHFFEKLGHKGVNSHYRALIEDDKNVKIDSLKKASNKMSVKLLRVLKPKVINGAYDYSDYKNIKNNFLIPLEVIYRNNLPAGSSIFKRLDAGTLSLSDIGLDKRPMPGETLNASIVEASTKLEITDRYISWEEAQKISGLSDREIDQIEKLTLLINGLISAEADKIGLINEDGKIEFGMDENRNIIVVDVTCTPDECRFTYKGVPVSKEVARDFYRKTAWYTETEKTKNENRHSWKDRVKINPPAMPDKFLKLISSMYQACCNEITGRDWFTVQPLQDVLGEMNDLYYKNDIKVIRTNRL